jgi:rhomboid protease GluP
VGVSAALSIFIYVRHFGSQAYGWLIVNGCLLGLVATANVAKVPFLAYVAAGAWAVFVVGAQAVKRRQMLLIGRLRFDAAARWARLGAWLHPFHGARDHATYYLALGDAIGGRFDEARARFNAIERSPELRDIARLEILRLDNDWGGVVAHVESRRAVRPELTRTAPYLRALGELGETSRLVEAFAAMPLPNQRIGALRLSVVAFAGRPDLVQTLFATVLADDPGPLRSYWTAVAEQAKGDVQYAKERLEQLVNDGVLVPQAQQRLLRPAPRVRPELLGPAAERTLAELGRDIQEVRVLPGVGAPPRKPIATFGLMAVLALVYVVGVSASKRVDIFFGALLLPPELIGGVGWRLVSAGFVHFNGIHLVMNLLGLWVLGRLIERSAGPLPLLAAFLGSSVGAYTIALFFMHASRHEPKYLVGASAGMFGLVGVMVTFAAIGYFIGRIRRFQLWLKWAASIVGIQLVFDAFHPMVSSFLHLAGLGSGAVLALPFALRTFGRKRAAPPPPNPA